ncbi:MAG: glycosyltransferase [Candidatus Poseidoniaceae archaeon]
MASICLVVTNGCAPDPRVERHARWLAEEGHEVSIFAWDRKHDLDEETIRDGYTILRKRIGQKASSSPVSIVRQKKKFLKSLHGQFDLLIHNDSDSIGTSNIRAAHRILDLHDIAHAWPVMQKTTFLRKFLSSRMEKQFRRSTDSYDGFFTSSPGLAAYFAQEFSIQSTVVLNVRNSNPLPRPRMKRIGFFGRIRDFDAMVLLVESCKQIGFSPIFAGDGPSVNRLVERYPDIDYRGQFDEKKLSELMSEIDVMYAMYNPEKENIRQGALPVKMFDAAAFGRPTVTTAGVPMGDFCIEHKLGTVASFGDVDSVADAIMKAYELDVVTKQTEEDERTKFMPAVESILGTNQEASH